MSDIAWREPEIFAAGDTLAFQRYLPAYLPAAGWSLRYVLTDTNTGNSLATFDSTTSTTDPTCHAVSVNNFAADIEQGDYILTGQAVNISGEKNQIYYAELTIQPNLADGTATAPILTTAQKMISTLEKSLADLYVQKFQETDVQRNRFVMQKQGEVLKNLQYWYEKRMNELAMERIRNGRSNPNDLMPVFRG
jgi:hypothetical protein